MGITLSDLEKGMEEAAQVDAKTRRKLGRSLGHIAMHLEKTGALRQVADMDIALHALALGAASHSYPQRYHMSRARLMKLRRETLGLREPRIAVEQARTLDVEAGALFIADVTLPQQGFVADDPMHLTMARLGFFCVALGGDGLVKTRMRLHESGPCEPQSSEFRRLREATPIGRVRCTSGQVRATGCGARKIVLDAPAGMFDVAAYGLGIGRAPECLVLLSPSTDQSRFDLTETPELLL